MHNEKRVSIKISGVVQGVGMRDYISRVASQAGIKGYVKNLPDGRVECVAESSSENIERLISNIKNAPRGKVEKVITENAPPLHEDLKDFTIRF